MMHAHNRDPLIARFRRHSERLCLVTSLLLLACPVLPQESSAARSTAVPFTISFTGTLRSFDGSPITTLTEVTFAIFDESEGGDELWTETRTVSPDPAGNFRVTLGETDTGKQFVKLFASGRARWLQMTSPLIPSQPRSELLSVPYAFKAFDTEMFNGRPVSDFVLRQGSQSSRDMPVPAPVAAIPSAKDEGRIFVSTAKVGPSFISSAVSGPPLEVQSAELVRDLNADMLHGFSDGAFAKLASGNNFSDQQLFAGGAVLTASASDPNAPDVRQSSPLDFDSSAVNPQTFSRVTRKFRWYASPMTSSSGATGAQLLLAFGASGNPPGPTGFSINDDGTLNFAQNQQFPAAPLLAALNDPSNASNTNPSNTATTYTAGYQWTQQLMSSGTQGGSQGIQPGLNTVQLTPCPYGVSGRDAWHYLYISGIGTPEIVLISGGTCVSGAKTGTIQFAASYAHGAGYTIGSATAGLQEALNASLAGGLYSRSVVINPGTYTLLARVSVRISGVHVLGYGAIITCMMSDTCIMLGDPSNSNTYGHITLEGPTMRPGVVDGTYPAIEDNANGSEIKSVRVAWGGPNGASFGHVVQIDNDQAATIDRIDLVKTSVLRCDSQFCGSAIFAPGPFAVNAAVGWISNSNLDSQCGGNGVDWQSGNTLSISNTVVQAYSQFGIRGGTARGGYGSIKMDNVYEEVGNCPNPAGNIGHAGVIVQGAGLSITGGVGPAGELPCFSTSCSGQQRRYYVVAYHSSYGSSNPLAAGTGLMSDSSTTVAWPAIIGASSYDLIAIDNVVAWYAGSSPTGRGAFAVSTGIPPSNCTSGVCTYVDTHGPLAPYSVLPPQYFPLLTFWPGPIVLGANGDSASVWSGATVHMDYASQPVVSVAGMAKISVVTDLCDADSALSPLWLQCEGSAIPLSASRVPQALILPYKSNADQNLFTNLKGRLNFATLGTGPNHIITLSDSDFQKTVATSNSRPLNDPDDAFVGYDRGTGDPSQIGISFGAPLSLTNYIGNVGDGTNWLERLTGNAKIIKVPLRITPKSFTSILNCDSSAEGALQSVSDSVTDNWGANIQGGGTYHVLAYCDGTNWTVFAK